VQVLGSGGPVADDARASSAYLVWVDGRARALVDIGGGAVLRFAEAGADFRDLDAVLLTHLHADHSAGLSYLRVVMVEIENDDSGADGADEPEEELEVSRIALRDSALRIDATGGSHGAIPAVFYRVEVKDRVIVFAGDHDGRSDALAAFAEDADVLVAHLPIAEDAGPGIRALHAAPSRVGDLAAAAEVGHLVLSHFMARSLDDLEANVAAVRRRYEGPVLVARDLSCLNLP